MWIPYDDLYSFWASWAKPIQNFKTFKLILIL